MKKLIVTSLSTTLYILLGASISHSQDAGFKQPDLILKDEKGNPKSNMLNAERCKSDFVTCAKISETASVSSSVYGDDWKTKIKQLNEPGVGWDKGFTTVLTKDTGLSNYDAQFVIASKKVKIAGEKEKTYLLIGIRGTQGKKDLETDGYIYPTKYGDVEIHSGFHNYASAIIHTSEYDELIQKIRDIDGKEDYEVMITGHSLGGAAATIIKANLESQFPSSKEKFSAITFGAPQVGNQIFADRYGDRVIRIITERDAIPSSNFTAVRVGKEEYTFENPATTAENSKQDFISRALEKINNSLNPWKLVADPLGSNHLSYFERDRYDSSVQNGWYNLRNDLMHRTLSGITEGGSSHIGSAAYYLGRSPYQDSVDISNAYRVEQFDGSKVQSIQQKEQYTTPAGSITNLKAPVDVVLNWNQSVAKGQLDLDSHLTGPAGLGNDSSVRFHTYFNSKGSIDTAPYTQLYRDVIPPSSSDNKNEQTRIQVLQDGIYRFYVHDYTNKDNNTSFALSQSEANVTVFNFGKNLPTERENLGTVLGSAIKVPTNQQGNVWRSFELDSRTGVLKPVINVPFGNISAPASVPTVGETFSKPEGTLIKKLF